MNTNLAFPIILFTTVQLCDQSSKLSTPDAPPASKMPILTLDVRSVQSNAEGTAQRNIAKSKKNA